MTTIWEYSERQARDGTETWRQAVLRAAELLTQTTAWDERYATAPPRESRLQAAALLIYGLAHERRAAPATISGQDLATWVASRSIAQGQNDLADLIRTAGHVVPQPGPTGCEDVDPVIAAWRALVDHPGWIPPEAVLSDVRTCPTLPEAFSEIIRVFGDPALSRAWAW